MRRLFVILAILFCATVANANCTGSGLAWTVAPGTTQAQFAACMTSSTNGAVFIFSAGTYTVGSLGGGSFFQFSPTKGSTFICATPPSGIGSATSNQCLISGVGPAMGTDTYAGTATNLYRISGFTFDLGGSESGLGTVYFDCFNGTCPATVSQLRVDHNTFQNGANGAQLSLIGGTDPGTIFNVYGVYDHNLVTNATQMALLIWVGVQRSPANYPASQLGTANNLFIEDNTLNFTALGNGSAEGCIDGWGGMAVVARHNTSTNCLWTAHGVTHGGGPSNVEFYNNSVSITDPGATGFLDCYRCFHHQGSNEMIAFNNSFTAFSGKNADALSLIHYRDGTGGADGSMPADAALCNGSVNGPTDAPLVIDQNRSPTGTYQGYRCWNQPGTDPKTQNLMPIYVWNNFWSDTLAQVAMNFDDIGGSPDYFLLHVVPNRDYFNAVSASAQSSATSPFNGTTGMGFGTLANRPTTCAANPNAPDAGFGGVGYAAMTVTGTIGSSTTEGTPTNAVLYHCSATNTWSAYYTPYTYPFPLVGAVPPPPAPATVMFAGQGQIRILGSTR